MKKILITTLAFISLNSFAGEMIGGGGSMMKLEGKLNLSNLTLEDIKSITTKDGAIILNDEIIDVDSQHNYYDHINKIKSFLLQNASSIQSKNIGRFIIL